MAFGSPTITCPRCNTVQPAQAQFCNTCGLQFSAAAPPTNLAAPPVLNTFQFPVAPQGYQPPDAPPPTPPPSGKGKLIIILVILAVVLFGGGIGGFLLLHRSSNPNSAGFDRHGLETSVPLPNNVTFALQDSTSQTFQAPPPLGTISITINRWLWLVAGSDPAAVQQFYIQNLPGKGWTQVVPTNNGDDKGVTACQGKQQALFIDISTKVTPPNKAPVTAPAGGSVLSIGLADSQNSPELVQLTCGGLPTLPTP